MGMGRRTEGGEYRRRKTLNSERPTPNVQVETGGGWGPGERATAGRPYAGQQEAGKRERGWRDAGARAARRSPVRGADGLDVERERKRNVALEFWGVFTGYSVSE